MCGVLRFAGGSGLTLNGVVVNGPFLGILALPTSTTVAESGATATLVYLGGSSTSGKTGISNMDVIADSNAGIANLS